MDFKTYVQSVVASYVEKQDRNVIFIKHYNTLDISKSEILASVKETKDEVFLYHEYAMHDMHEAYAPFMSWIRQCFALFYRDKMSVEDFLKECNVYPMHIEPLAGFIRNDICTRKEDVLPFEIQYETHRMMQNMLGILEHISKAHHLVLILSKFHLAPYSAIKLFREIIGRTMNVHAILMYNDEFNIAEYKKSIWEELLQKAEDQNLQLEWGSMDSERTIDMQDDFWFDSARKSEYLLKLKNMYYVFSLDDAYYYMNDILYRLDEKTIWLTKSEQIQFLQLAAMIDMNLKQVDHALVLCDKLTDLCMHSSENSHLLYNYYYTCARVRVLVSQIKLVEQNCKKCVELALEMGDSFLACKAEILLWCGYCGIGNDIFEYDFSFKLDMEIVEKAKLYGFTNFLAYIYIFGFENEPETIEAVAKGEKELYYFNLGVQIGTAIENDNLLLNAYMKNIILYSRSGNHNYVREMYVKRLGVLKRPNPLREAHMFAGLGYNSIILEDYEKANSYLMQSVLTLTDLEEPDDVVNSLYNLAMNYLVAGSYQSTIQVIELMIKMLREMGYNSVRACSTTKLYSMIAIACYYQKEYYNSYYYLSKIEVIVEHMLKVLKKENGSAWDEDFQFYHLVKGMLYNYENRFDLCQKEFDELRNYMKTSSGSLFLIVPIYATEQATLYNKQGKKAEAEGILREAIKFCDEEGMPRKKKKLEYFLEHGEIDQKSSLIKTDKLHVERILQISRQAGTQNKLVKKEKDIKFLTVLQEAISRENMTVDDLYINTSAVIKSSYNVDDIIILRRKDNKKIVMKDDEEEDLSDEEFNDIFSFFKTYKQAFLTNRLDKNFIQFMPIMKSFDAEHISTMIGIPIIEQSGTETVLLGFVKIKRRTVNSRSLLNGDDLMILKFAFSQFCEMMRRIDNRVMIERMNQKLEQSAITDHLTGITNRNGFSKQADILCSQDSTTVNAILYLDLDNFKYYNDTFGHDVGDLVLVCFADMFKRMTRGKGLAVRYGGDEFIILLYNQTQRDAARFAERIYEEVKDGFVPKIRVKLGKEIDIPDNKKISCSIGIAEFHGGSKEELELALNHADQMLYDVKRNGKSHYRMYNGNNG